MPENVGIVVESLDNANWNFSEIGLTRRTKWWLKVNGQDRVTGLGDQSVEVAMMSYTPDGHSRLELSQFLHPKTIADHRTNPVNSLGYPKSNVPGLTTLIELLGRLEKQS